MEAAKDIGGDFYDFFRIDDDHIALVIGDVCGKGIPAALFMAVSRTFIRSVGMQYEHVGECITNVNRLLASSSVEYMFVTVFYAIYDIRTGLLTYCNGGHNPPYLLHANGTTEQLPMTQNAMVGAYKCSPTTTAISPRWPRDGKTEPPEECLILFSCARFQKCTFLLHFFDKMCGK